MKRNNTYKFLLYSFGLCLLVALLSGYFYVFSPDNAINSVGFTKTLRVYEKQADRLLAEYESVLLAGSVDSLSEIKVLDDAVGIFVFSDQQLLYWTDNRLDVDGLNSELTQNESLVALPNAYCIMKSRTVDKFKIVALIPIKNNFPYENETLQNEFSQGFRLNKHIEIIEGTPLDDHSISSSNGEYLFSLKAPDFPVYSSFWGWLGFASQILCFVFLLLLYASSSQFVKNRKLMAGQFLWLTLSVLVLLGLSLYFKFPKLLYWNHIFSPLQYASNPFLASLGHLTLITAFFLSATYLFYFHTHIPEQSKVLYSYLFKLLFTLCFVFFYNIISSLVFHSSIQISILSFQDFTWISLWVHFLILIWGVGLSLFFYKTHNILKPTKGIFHALKTDLPFILFSGFIYYFISPRHVWMVLVSQVLLLLVYYIPYTLAKRRSVEFYSFWWVLAYCLFFVLNSLMFNVQKDFAKYRVLAENIMINGNSENDGMTDILLEELDSQLKNDETLYRLTASPDSVMVANAYLNETYLRGFWNKYDMRLNIAQSRSEIDYQYQVFIEQTGTKLYDTHFYRIPASYNDMSYLGIFPNVRNSGDTLFFYMEFYPRKNFKSYSFPNLLINASPDIQNRMGISIGRYENSELVYATDGFILPPSNHWISQNKSDFYSIRKDNRKYFLYQPVGKSQIVIAESRTLGLMNYLLYFAYTFLFFYLLTRFFIRAYFVSRRKKDYHPGLTSKYQYAFVTLLIFSFLGIFYVSVNYIRNKYSEEQIVKLENKKKYIQKALQEMYYWNRDLSAVETQALNFDLQELSLTYQTDIHVYDHNGRLVGSSQPLIFNKNLISRYMSPVPFFGNNPDINQSEHIGDLKYLSGYTILYNGDYLQIGYIAVPQFLSQEETRHEIQDFLGVIIHIYLIIIVLSVILSIFIGRQLSAPLKLIENKLKQMRFGHRNEKIDYQLNDEVGQLVAQYNRTVDELEKSAQLLAQSERETAWKTMARQIAHEINNPLTPMKLTIQQLQRTHKSKDERFDDYFEKSTVTLIEQINNLSRIAGTFSNFARMPEAQFVAVDVAVKLKSVVQLFAHNHEQTVIHYEGLESGVMVLADPEQLTQVFNNLLKNAIQAIPSNRKGKIVVNLKTENDEAVFAVSDNGSGMPEEVSAKLFMPNFTTKSTGMGLGLSITRNIVEITGGTISFDTNPENGTTFIVKLPLYN